MPFAAGFAGALDVFTAFGAAFFVVAMEIPFLVDLCSSVKIDAVSLYKNQTIKTSKEVRFFDNSNQKRPMSADGRAQVSPKVAMGQADEGAASKQPPGTCRNLDIRLSVIPSKTHMATYKEYHIMFTRILAAFVVLPILVTGTAQAKPGGCFKYGAAGAVGGHIVHHGILGALAGCAYGHHVRHRYNEERRIEERQGPQQYRYGNQGYDSGRHEQNRGESYRSYAAPRAGYEGNRYDRRNAEQDPGR